MEQLRTTKEVAKILDVPIGALNQAIYHDKIDAPIKQGRSYKWSEANINQASWRLLHRMPETQPQRREIVI